MKKRLSSLELQGIKTFATTTRLEFPGQITAIIGPNGSGKSNIADSVRWVLGEQSYSTLRAKRTEDMIFSGSDQRSRAGMASATITFDNEDGWLPIDYSEVSISRRAYRDGQNEYLLNGQKVRLKDVSEILSQTGLSERTYTIIGQGLVDVALALRPDERRELFEEAAGIGLYRSRKEDALRRLETTQKNIERVLDILAEIKPRLRSLERQAGRYQEYEALQFELQQMLRDWYGYHWHQKQQDLKHVRFSYQDQEKHLSTLREKHEEVVKKVEESRLELGQNRSELEKTHRELSEFHQTLEGVNRELTIIDERQRSYAHQKSNLEMDIANLQEEMKELAIRKKSLEDEIEQQTIDVNNASLQAQQVQQQLALITAQKDEKEAHLEEVRNSRIALETEKVKITAHIGSLKDRVRSFLDEKNKIEASIRDLEQEVKLSNDHIGNLKDNFLEKEQKSLNFENNLDSLINRLNEVRMEKDGIDQNIGRHETNLAKFQARLDVLEQAEAALSGYSEGSKAIVEESRKGRLPSGIEPLSKHIIVDGEHEKAISAALGELADLLVVPSMGTNAVIEYLISRESERVALIPMENDKHPKPANRFEKLDGYIGRANSLIKVDTSLRNLIDKLFSDIHVVHDEQCAGEIQPDLDGIEMAVTLKGLVFQSNGILISGQAASGKRLGRTRQRSELNQEIERLQASLKIIYEQKIAIEKSFLSLTEQLKSMRQKHLEAVDEKESAQKAVQAAEEKLHRLKEQRRWHQDRLLSIQLHIKENETLIDQNSMNKSGIEEKLAGKKEEEKAFLDSLAELPIFEIQKAFNRLNTQKLVAENGLKALQERFLDHKQRIQESEGRLTTLVYRLNELEDNLETIRHKHSELNQSAAEMTINIEKLQADQIKPLSKEKEKISKQVNALEKLEEHSHQQVMMAERKFTQLQLEMSRRDDQLENLREKIEDDFGLVSFVYEESIEGPNPLPFNEELIQSLPTVKSIPEKTEVEIKSLKSRIKRIGVINPEAQTEYIAVKERHEFLTQQIDDLEKAGKDLQEVIRTLDGLMEREFLQTFKAVKQEFSGYFSRLFNGGEAKLVISDENNPVEGGVDIIARLPGRRQQGLALLSGGERSLTAVALIFALLKVSPTPFCILDEVDAMLDESNVGRFTDLLRELAENTQFVLITHNRNSVQVADVIYGVTMGRDSTSQMISLKLEDVDEKYFEG